MNEIGEARRPEESARSSGAGKNDGDREQWEPAGRAASKRAVDLHARIAQKGKATSRRLSSTSAGHLWRRLDAMDFINRGMLFAAVLFLCFVPFIIVVQSLAGRSSATSLIRRFGLTPQPPPTSARS